MRTLKFRAWDKEGMRMITENEDGEYLWVFQNGEIKILAECEIAKECGGEIVFIYDWLPINVDIMQYTGIKDKNGKEIYEGDILILGNNLGNVMEDSKTKKLALYEVKIQNCDFILKRPDMDFIWGRLSRIEELAWDCEVIGNIRENLEILNK